MPGTDLRTGSLGERQGFSSPGLAQPWGPSSLCAFLLDGLHSQANFPVAPIPPWASPSSWLVWPPGYCTWHWSGPPPSGLDSWGRLSLCPALYDLIFPNLLAQGHSRPAAGSVPGINSRFLTRHPTDQASARLLCAAPKASDDGRPLFSWYAASAPAALFPMPPPEVRGSPSPVGASLTPCEPLPHTHLEWSLLGWMVRVF